MRVSVTGKAKPKCYRHKTICYEGGSTNMSPVKEWISNKKLKGPLRMEPEPTCWPYLDILSYPSNWTACESSRHAPVWHSPLAISLVRQVNTPAAKLAWQWRCDALWFPSRRLSIQNLKIKVWAGSGYHFSISACMPGTLKIEFAVLVLWDSHTCLFWLNKRPKRLKSSGFITPPGLRGCVFS